MELTRYFIIGGAGFIGSHFVDRLLNQQETENVTIYDNFSSGKPEHYSKHINDQRLRVIKADVHDFKQLAHAMIDHHIVIHLASNPDIARAAIEPSIDFNEGLVLTHLTLEAMRMNQIKRLIYISGSGVYGDVGLHECKEEDGKLYPVSIYGASKLAGEAFISAYCHMFDLTASIFRLANVVGPRQTHGVAYDFINKLLKNPHELVILGNGLQSKSYVHIDDVINAILLANSSLRTGFEIYNIATNDSMTVNDIADIVIKNMGFSATTKKHYKGGDSGWKGDVPIVRLNTDKIRHLGWCCQRNSAVALQAAVSAMLNEKISDQHTIHKMEISHDTTPLS